MALQPSLDLAQARGPFQLAIEQRHELALGRQLTHPSIGAVRLDQPLENVPRHLLQKPVKNAIVVPHGIAPPCVRIVPNNPNPSGINAVRLVHQNLTGQPWPATAST